MTKPFWPQNKRAALSLSFDDARPSQWENGLPLLDRYGVKGTFYVMPRRVEHDFNEWKNALANGHEIGNHTMTHPCSGNFTFVHGNALEEYSLAQMEAEIQDANSALQSLLGATPRTFAYPCGQTYVGRGAETQSYVPLAAKHFLAGRGYNSESANDPTFCDLAQLMAIPADVKEFSVLENHFDKTLQDGHWLILAAHDVTADGRQSIAPRVLEEICHYAERHSELWVDTVANIAAYVKAQRS